MGKPWRIMLHGEAEHAHKTAEFSQIQHNADAIQTAADLGSDINLSG
jgi:hypothetical protein